jgi:uncharacterized RDD family membrane protein YckC
MEALAGAPLASFGKRALAFVIDFAVAAVSFVVFFFYILFPYLPRWMVILGFWRPGRHNIDFSFHEWPSLVFLTLYFGLSTYWSNGRTPGKWLCGIRVVSLTHRRITLWTAIERALGYGASVLELGSGFLQYFVAPNHRTVHDRIAETIVVEVRRSKWSEGATAAAMAERPLDPHRGGGVSSS